MALPAVPSFAAVPSKSLSFYNTHTGEQLKTTFWEGGNFVTESLGEIDFILRDFRTNDIHAIDPTLLEIVHRLITKLGTRKPVQVISGYRSPATNAMLAAASGGVAKRSYHLAGRAIDLRIEGISTRELQRAALSLRAGGVGYYPKPAFVHVDTGPIRRW